MCRAVFLPLVSSPWPIVAPTLEGCWCHQYPAPHPLSPPRRTALVAATLFAAASAELNTHHGRRCDRTCRDRHRGRAHSPCPSPYLTRSQPCPPDLDFLRRSASAALPPPPRLRHSGAEMTAPRRRFHSSPAPAPRLSLNCWSPAPPPPAWLCRRSSGFMSAAAAVASRSRASEAS